ncbi:pseudouridine synthase PUS1 [Cyberlindnera jadinii NRRL Y-1542]|uniref:tRNA pseudouridine synthase 1 n=1 Tax=Cyberlindnera jadinii (strain ATCC 18201 / CBS 1600 / BCRC 20928 / JCM 3617 / NBRC 0987 / NRRL Y-1542) TaxID=983966 RepID=A0A1E4S172_CYBJN|nr:tRNA:pseudouridine synthase [Cyberlindnera jadinii NRRL Y-1542]ODV73254.1 tRNA:pseudouridine synthase [Cyberlindnera jadinii NRRL Y-1542]
MSENVEAVEEQSAEALQRGQRSKWSKARKADFEGRKGNKRQKQDNWERQERAPALDDEGNPIPKRPKKKLAVMLGYCGAGYHGMQMNPPQKTIEGDLFQAFVKVGAIHPFNADDPKKSGFMRAARTDKGVHAAGNVISLKLMEDEDLVKKLNDVLPETIRIWGIERTNKAFDCRKMCGSRIYEYLLPTYSLIAPNPSSYLGKRIAEEDEKTPGITRKDEESDKFWALYEEKVKEANFTEEELQKIKDFNPTSQEEYENSGDVAALVKRFKAVESNCKRQYRISTEKLEMMREAMSMYLGHHNFHNFTIGKGFKDASASRFMKEISVSDPFVIDQTEWVSVKIHGQSFMLHQIRKMIAMASLVVRTGCPLERITQAFDSDKINIPKAPALGLLLEQPVYSGYNQRLNDFGYKPIDFNNYEKEMQEFKMKHIYDKIYAEEVSENVFNAFFKFVDAYSNEGFEYLTAKGITKAEPAQPAGTTEAVDLPEAPKAPETTESTEAAATTETNAKAETDEQPNAEAQASEPKEEVTSTAA